MDQVDPDQIDMHQIVFTLGLKMVHIKLRSHCGPT